MPRKKSSWLKRLKGICKESAGSSWSFDTRCQLVIGLKTMVGCWAWPDHFWQKTSPIPAWPLGFHVVATNMGRSSLRNWSTGTLIWLAGKVHDPEVHTAFFSTRSLHADSPSFSRVDGRRYGGGSVVDCS